MDPGQMHGALGNSQCQGSGSSGLLWLSMSSSHITGDLGLRSYRAKHHNPLQGLCGS